MAHADLLEQIAKEFLLDAEGINAHFPSLASLDPRISINPDYANHRTSALDRRSRRGVH